MLISNEKIENRIIEHAFIESKMRRFERDADPNIVYSFQILDSEIKTISLNLTNGRLVLDNVFFAGTVLISANRKTDKILIKNSSINNLVIVSNLSNYKDEKAEVILINSIIGDSFISSKGIKLHFEGTIILSDKKCDLKNVETFERSKVFLSKNCNNFKKVKACFEHIEDHNELKKLIEDNFQNEAFFSESLNNFKKEKMTKLDSFRFEWLGVDFKFVTDEFISFHSSSSRIDDCLIIPKKFKVTGLKIGNYYFDDVDMKKFPFYHEFKKFFKNFDGTFKLYEEYEFNLTKMFFEQEDIIYSRFMFVIK